MQYKKHDIICELEIIDIFFLLSDTNIYAPLQVIYATTSRNGVTLMKNILDELITLERRAKEILRPAENELANLERIIKSKSSEIIDEADKTLSTKITQMRTLNKEQTAAKKAEIDKETSFHLAKLEEEWVKNAQTWQEEMLNEIKGCLKS